MNLNDHPSKHNILPFIFQPVDENLISDETIDENGKRSSKTVVLIAYFDCLVYDAAWMDDERIGKQALVPDVDFVISHREFNSEREAIDFVRSWWVSAKCGDYEYFVKK